MRKYLLPESGNFYKANLHSHSTVSDGKKSPEEMKKFYMERGYSIIAYTDHRILIGHNDLSDENFLALNGWELDVTREQEDIFTAPTCHINFIALDPDNLIQPIWDRTENIKCGNNLLYKDQVQIDESKPDYKKVYEKEKISEMMKIGRDAGFYVIWCHPTSSLEDYEDYITYEGMHAMEMFNGCGLSLGYEDYHPHIYDAMIKKGKKIFCVGADDNHNGYGEPPSRVCDSFWAFTMIKADNLEYRSITDALLKGNFYASEGPEIYDLWYEDGKAHIKCSDADRIYLTTYRRKIGRKFRENEPLTEATFTIPEDVEMFRITVVDGAGKHAHTNTYFMEDILKEK